MTGAIIDDLLPDAVANQQLVLDEQAFPFAPLKELAREGALTAVGLDLSAGDEWTFDAYAALGTYLGIMNRSCMWWIGDWLLYGEGRYDERFAQAAANTGLAEQTLQNRMYVCRNVPVSMRRVGLAFSVHAEVASLKTAREQKYWLDRAAKAGWNRQQLRDAMAAKRKETKPPIDLGDHERVDVKLVVEAAQAVVSARKEYGADFLVPREAMARLIGALGEEE